MRNCKQPSYGQTGVVTGPKDCKIPTKDKEFSLFNIMDTEATDCKVTWEKKENCPAQDCGTGGKIKAKDTVKVSYIAEAPCGRMSLTVKKGGTLTCTGLTDVASPDFYFIKDNEKTCEVSTSPIGAKGAKNL